MEEDYEKEDIDKVKKRKRSGSFSDGCIVSTVLSIIIIFLMVTVLGRIIGTIIETIIDVAISLFSISTSKVTIVNTTEMIIVFGFPIIAGFFGWIKYKDENKRLALGFLVGTFMPIIICLVIYGSCGLMLGLN